jgi:multidrug efflux system outer membrane protein
MVSIMALSGCKVGPNYKQPCIDPPKQFVSQYIINEINQDKKRLPLLINWWEGFEDKTLNNLVDVGLSNNYEIAFAMGELERAKGELIIASAGYNLYSNGDVDVGYEIEKSLKPGNSANQRNAFFNINVVQPFDIFGKVARRVEAANAQVSVARNNLQAVLLRVSSEIAFQYLFLRGKQQQLGWLQISVDLERKTRNVVLTRYNAGLAPQLDLTRSEAAVALLEASVPRLQETLTNTRNKIAELSGFFPGEFHKSLLEAKRIPEYQNRIPTVFPLQMLRVRPDVRQAEDEFKRNIALVGAAVAEFYPTFELSGAFSIGSIASNINSAMDLLVAAINAALQQVVIDNGVLQGNLAVAKANAMTALANYRQTLLTASQEVETSLAAIIASLESQKSLAIAVTNSTYSYKKAEVVYQQGLLSFLDVLDAQRALVNAEQQLAIEQTNFATSLATLFKALGSDVTASKLL